MALERFYTYKQAAEILGFKSAATMKSIALEHQLKIVYVRSRPRIPQSELERYQHQIMKSELQKTNTRDEPLQQAQQQLDELLGNEHEN